MGAGLQRATNPLREHCFGKTPMQTFLDSKHIAIEKQLNRTFQTTESVLATANNCLSGQVVATTHHRPQHRA